MSRETFAQWLDREMKQRGWSNELVARKVGVTHATVSKWRQGAYKPRWEKLEPIARQFRVDVEFVRQLAGYEGEEGSAVPVPPSLHDLLNQLEARAPWEIPVQRDFAHAGEGGETAQFVYLAPRRTKREGVIAVEVQGDCMEPEISRGDTVIADINVPPQNGDIVVADIDGRAEIRRYYRQDGTVELVPDNEDSGAETFRVSADTPVWTVIQIQKMPRRRVRHLPDNRERA